MVHNYGTIGSFENKNDKKKYKIGIGFVMLGFAAVAFLLISSRYLKGRIGDLTMSNKSWFSTVLMNTNGIVFPASTFLTSKIVIERELWTNYTG